jgi:hypothetical protein
MEELTHPRYEYYLERWDQEVVIVRGRDGLFGGGFWRKGCNQGGHPQSR